MPRFSILALLLVPACFSAEGAVGVGGTGTDGSSGTTDTGSMSAGTSAGSGGATGGSSDAGGATGSGDTGSSGGVGASTGVGGTGSSTGSGPGSTAATGSTGSTGGVGGCDPLMPDCEVGEGCYPTGTGWECSVATDTLGPNAPCLNQFVCAPGFACGPDYVFASCSILCCAQYCAVAGPDTCPAPYFCIAIPWGNGDTEVGLCGNGPGP